jgi:hypothetical protein
MINITHILKTNNILLISPLTVLLLIVALLPLFSSPVSAVDVEEFQFKVTVTADSLNFAIPLSGRLNAGTNPYNWDITWGDGTLQSGVSGSGSASSAGISHTYASAGTYTITITPAGSEDRWFAAFGFSTITTSSGANVQTNRDKVTEVLSPLTPRMTRTAAEVNPGVQGQRYEWAYTFCGCRNLVMGPAFTFSDSWNIITQLSGYFAIYMFEGCNGDAFTMGAVFNLPQGLTVPNGEFCRAMFQNCNGASFTMNSVFNMPENMSMSNTYFAQSMFYGCNGDAFTMNSVFNLPQKITTVGTSFAYSRFYGCSGASFTMSSVFNLPQKLVTVKGSFAAGML